MCISYDMLRRPWFADGKGQVKINRFTFFCNFILTELYIASKWH